MLSRRFFALGLLSSAAACTTIPASNPGQRPQQQQQAGRTRVYRISPGDVGRLQVRMLDSVNTLRRAADAPPLALNAQLNAAAATHARDMSIQNRPWHFGSDGSSPIDRVRRVGFGGRLIGENISETYETELQTLTAWMAQPDTRRTIMAAEAREMGFSWFQEPNGKIWWVLVTGSLSVQPTVPDQNPSASRLVPQSATSQTPNSVESTPGVVTIQTTPLG